MMNALLISSSLPASMQREAILSACYIQNEVPHKKFNKTPYELWYNKPNLGCLKVQGCLTKIALPDHKKMKLGSCTYDFVFISYAQKSIAYRFLVLKSDVL